MFAKAHRQINRRYTGSAKPTTSAAYPYGRDDHASWVAAKPNMIRRLRQYRNEEPVYYPEFYMYYDKPQRRLPETYQNIFSTREAVKKAIVSDAHYEALQRRKIGRAIARHINKIRKGE